MSDAIAFKQFGITREPTPFIEIDMVFKIIIVGDTGVGKTCLIRRFGYNEFDEVHSVTIGGDFINVFFMLDGSKKVKIQLWDTCGLEQYRSLVRLYFKGTHAALIAYDMSEKIGDAVKMWHEEIKNNTSNEIPVYLVGTKADLGSDKNSKDEIGALMSSLGFVDHFLTSAKAEIGINEMFMKILNNLYVAELQKSDKSKKRFDEKLKLNRQKANNGKSCCS